MAVNNGSTASTRRPFRGWSLCLGLGLSPSSGCGIIFSLLQSKAWNLPPRISPWF